MEPDPIQNPLRASVRRNTSEYFTRFANHVPGFANQSEPGRSTFNPFSLYYISRIWFHYCIVFVHKFLMYKIHLLLVMANINFDTINGRTSTLSDGAVVHCDDRKQKKNIFAYFDFTRICSSFIVLKLI